jgi:hypothetical protein
MTATSAEVDWPKLIDGILLAKLIEYGSSNRDMVDTVFLTGSYTRGSWNPVRPNVNVYFISEVGRAARVRLTLGRVFADIRRELHDHDVEFAVDCHPYTISQLDPAWTQRPLLTLTTKVFDNEYAAERYHVSPTIGLGWFVGHKILLGRDDALTVFGQPAIRDQLWVSGVHQALSQYRNILDHLPWAIDGETAPSRILEESCRYAEEALRDGVHIALTDDELAHGKNIDILFAWRDIGRRFYAERYGEEGLVACDIVDRLKSQVTADPCDPDTAGQAWLDALRVWRLVWEKYRALAIQFGAGPELLRVTAWL